MGSRQTMLAETKVQSVLGSGNGGPPKWVVPFVVPAKLAWSGVFPKWGMGWRNQFWGLPIVAPIHLGEPRSTRVTWRPFGTCFEPKKCPVGSVGLICICFPRGGTPKTREAVPSRKAHTRAWYVRFGQGNPINLKFSTTAIRVHSLDICPT